jgi:hypothetical protein
MSSSLAIGDFSRATHLSVKTLRHYHRLGLLIPAEALEQPAQGHHGLLGLHEALLEPGQVFGDQCVAGIDVGCLQHGTDLVQRHRGHQRTREPGRGTPTA